MPEQPNHCTGCGVLMPYTNAAYYCSRECMDKVRGTHTGETIDELEVLVRKAEGKRP